MRVRVPDTSAARRKKMDGGQGCTGGKGACNETDSRQFTLFFDRIFLVFFGVVLRHCFPGKKRDLSRPRPFFRQLR